VLPLALRFIRIIVLDIRLVLLSVVILVLLIGVAWAFGALWFDFPIPALRRALAAAFGLAAIGALAFVRPRWGARVGVAGLGKALKRIPFPNTIKYIFVFK